MFLAILSLVFFVNPEQQAATKGYWIGLNDIIHNFNKTVNTRPGLAVDEIKKSVAKIRSMSTRNVDSLVLIYAEKRIQLAMDYAEFLQETNFASEEYLFKAEYSIKRQKQKLENVQKRFQELAERHRHMDAEQEILVSYLREKFDLDVK